MRCIRSIVRNVEKFINLLSITNVHIVFIEILNSYTKIITLDRYIFFKNNEL